MQVHVSACMGMQQDWTRVGRQCEGMQQEIRKGGPGCMEMQQSCLGVWSELGRLILSGVCKILETIRGISQPPLYWVDYGGVSCNALICIFPDFSELVLNCCLWDKLSFELACYLLSCSYSLLSKNPHNNSFWDTFNCVFFLSSWHAMLEKDIFGLRCFQGCYRPAHAASESHCNTAPTNDTSNFTSYELWGYILSAEFYCLEWKILIQLLISSTKP